MAGHAAVLRARAPARRSRAPHAPHAPRERYATAESKRSMPSSIGALVALAANNCTSNKAAGDERTPDAAGTGARARCAHGSQRARVALTSCCGSPSASGASAWPTGNLCSPRARPSSKNSACADGADHQPAVKNARPGGAVREGSREALSAPRVVARGRPQLIEAAQGAAASVSRERAAFDRPWHGLNREA